MSRVGAVLAFAALITACRSPSPPAPRLGRVVVHEFAVNERVTKVSRYDQRLDGLGMKVAAAAVAELHERDRDALAARDGDGTPGEVVVTGRVTRLDGGSQFTRALVSGTIGGGFTSYGMGGATCAVEGEVKRADGSPVGVFRESATKRSTGWFWIRFGESSEKQIEQCLADLGTDIAEMIDDGEYRTEGGVAILLGRTKRPS